MERNQITYTSNFGLAVIGEDQDKVKFKDFRTKLMGTADSNMTKIDAALASKQDAVSPDAEPELNSTNAVSSGGVYSALALKGDSLSLSGGKLSLSSCGTPIGDEVELPASAQADWNEADETSPAYIKNKPDITGGSSGTGDIPTQEKTIEINISGKVSENQAYGSIVKLKPAEHATALEYAKANGSLSAASVTLGGSISDVVFNSVELRKFETSDNVYVTPAGDNVAIFKVDPEGMVHGYALYKYGYEKGDNIRIKFTLTHPKIGSCYLDDDIVRKKELEDVLKEIQNIKAELAAQ